MPKSPMQFKVTIPQDGSCDRFAMYISDGKLKIIEGASSMITTDFEDFKKAIIALDELQEDQDGSE